VQPVSSTEWEQIGNEIHVWRAPLDRAVDVVSRLESALSPDEKARADRYHFVNDRNRFVVARGLLRELLGKYLQQNPASLSFSYGQHGKPSVSRQADFVLISRTRLAWQFTRSLEGEILGLMSSISGQNPRARRLPSAIFQPAR
jgi:phosphopantetheinyl transferase